MGKNLLRISDLSVEEINDVLNQAQNIKEGKIVVNHNNKIVANLFFEPSTRTHYSFVTAEYKLGCHPIDFSPSSSSLVKGETFYDTVRTFEMFGVDAIVIRSLQNE
jgi:aspartate carbamoyltransferase catalytic subunit